MFTIDGEEEKIHEVGASILDPSAPCDEYKCLVIEADSFFNTEFLNCINFAIAQWTGSSCS